MTYTNASHRNLLDESHTCNLLSFLQLPSAGSNNPAHASPNDGAFASPSCHRPLFWGVVLRHVLGLELHLWLWLVLGLDGLWLWICDLWLWYLTCGCDMLLFELWLWYNVWKWFRCDIYVIIVMFVIYMWHVIYIWTVCVSGMQKTKKITVSVDLPSAMVMALGKAGKLCRVAGHCTRQRFFLKKSKKSLPSAKLGRHSAKSFF